MEEIREKIKIFEAITNNVRQFDELGRWLKDPVVAAEYTNRVYNILKNNVTNERY